MIIGNVASQLVHAAAQNRVGVRVSLGADLIGLINKIMPVLRGINRIKHHAGVAAGSVLHADRQIYTAGNQPMMLIFNRPCADRHISQNIIKIGMVVRVQHFVRGDKIRLLQNAKMHLADGL